MDYHKKIRIRLKSLPHNHERRENILTTLVEAFERGGHAAAIEALTQPMDVFEDKFTEKLAQLRKFL